ncbi:MAG: nicotinate phosphoribosyltransferase [Ruminococcaceae bacterium]|nr:nicotinate phosphoribosyltransferase [Oscillospiraceae bacterium]
MERTERNLSMLTDFYELTMAGGYFENGRAEEIGIFDMFYRKNPDNAGFSIFAGLEQLIDYLNNLSFSDEDIDYLREKKIFSEEFLRYLRGFQFSCDVWAMEEGTPMFPGEPIVIVKGPMIQAQLVETMVLLTINHQSLVCTKANRIVRAAAGRAVFEFGSRRAQSYDAALLGARAAYIAGCAGTACVMADRDYGIPALGTMAHSWIQFFDSEYEAFAAYARLYPTSCTLLVDTYNVLSSGVPNAIRVFDEVLKPMGYRPNGIRIDSGDIAYLSKKARKMLDDAGYPDVKIVASNSLDEYIIRDLLIQNAPVDIFGVGENLITAKSCPVFGGVYKLVGVERDGTIIPKIKLSESSEKITTPHFKSLYRFFSQESGKAIADYIALHGETVDVSDGIEIFDPVATWKRRTLENITCKPMLKQIFRKGICIYQSPDIYTIRANCLAGVESLWDEEKRFEFPHVHYVDYSQALWNVKNDLLSAKR